MTSRAGFVGNMTHLQQELWAEAMAVTTKIENSVVTTHKTMSAYNNLHRREAPHVCHLKFWRIWGVTCAQKICSKLDNWDKPVPLWAMQMNCVSHV